MGAVCGSLGDACQSRHALRAVRWPSNEGVRSHADKISTIIVEMMAPIRGKARTLGRSSLQKSIHIDQLICPIRFIAHGNGLAFAFANPAFPSGENIIARGRPHERMRRFFYFCTSCPYLLLFKIPTLHASEGE